MILILLALRLMVVPAPGHPPSARFGAVLEEAFELPDVIAAWNANTHAAGRITRVRAAFSPETGKLSLAVATRTWSFSCLANAINALCDLGDSSVAALTMRMA